MYSYCEKSKVKVLSLRSFHSKMAFGYEQGSEEAWQRYLPVNSVALGSKYQLFLISHHKQQEKS
jgi:hypothetical protein